MQRQLYFYLILIQIFFYSQQLRGQGGSDYVYFKNFIKHASGELCTHIPPATSFMAYLNNDQSKILIENAPRWISGGEPNIPGNGTFGVELGNFRDPAISAGDSVFISFTCNHTSQQGLLKSRVTAIPWYYFPVFLNLQTMSIPTAPQNVTLARDTSTSYRQIAWTQEPGMIYDIYRRSYGDTLPDGQARMMYELIRSAISTNSFVFVDNSNTEPVVHNKFAVAHNIVP